MSDSTRTTVAKTLRQVAGWIPEETHGAISRSEMYAIADEVEQELGVWEICCPVCEEVICGSPCPLAEVRKQLAELERAEDE
jgi:hypothetical protein